MERSVHPMQIFCIKDMLFNNLDIMGCGVLFIIIEYNVTNEKQVANNEEPYDWKKVYISHGYLFLLLNLFI
jgi:hypothetical protein